MEDRAGRMLLRGDVVLMLKRVLFEQHQIASGTLHSSNLLAVALMEMKLDTNAYDIVSMRTT